ncbi:MAG: serine/threonine protein kinase [Anaerolineae bacterium]|nr:MAG: serine/threonine protein kinase [Anaerolineae bacterium]
MSNPYLARGPLRQPEMFFGRTRALQEISAFVRANQSISLVGPRKIGKTSLLYHLQRPVTRKAYDVPDSLVMVYLDCEVLGDLEHNAIFAQFAAETQMALEDAALEPEPTLEQVLERPSRLTWESAVRRLNRRGLQLLLILDEFERLSTNTHLDVNFFNALRSAAGRYQLAYLTASAHPLIALTYAERSQDILSSPFFNIFAPLFLGLLEEEEARALIQQPSEAAGAPIPEECGTFIYNLVGGHPFGLQIACFHALESGNDQAYIEQHTLEELQPHFQYYWNNLSAAEQSSLQDLEGITARSHNDTNLRRILRDLTRKCLLVERKGHYAYASRAWQAFVQQQSSPTMPAASLTPTRHGGKRYIGAYEVLRELARGGMSEVYLAQHTRLQREVVIKLLSPSLAGEADFRSRFEHEAQTIAALRHPNIVQVYDFGETEGSYYMVMEYLRGPNLARYLKEHAPLSLEETVRILRDIAAALDYAHSRGVIHRDIKPSNVMLEEPQEAGGAPRAVLTDFGIAKLRSREMTSNTKTGVMMGTLNYMAPEQIRSAGDVDGRADVYALGVMLFEMLTGRLPFADEHPGTVMLAHLQSTPPSVLDYAPHLPISVEDIVQQALAKEPQERPPTAGALAAALQTTVS